MGLPTILVVPSNLSKGNEMYKRSLAAFAAVGTIIAIAIPSMAGGNARRTVPTGSFSAMAAADTPYLAKLSGANEVPPADPDGTGAAAITIHTVSPTETQLCWDLSYSAIAAPTAAHIHRGAAGASGPPIVTFALPGATSGNGCIDVDAVLAAEIIATPAGFYVNIHTAEHPNGAIRGQLSLGAAPAGSAHLLPVPLRAYDSRATGLSRIAGGSTRTISLANASVGVAPAVIAVPPGATAAIVTLTVTQTDGPGGFLKLYNAAVAEPSTSTVNWTAADSDVATTTTVAVDVSGQVKVTAGSAGTHIIIDVIGYTF
jgi:CHRD domain